MTNLTTEEKIKIIEEQRNARQVNYYFNSTCGTYNHIMHNYNGRERCDVKLYFRYGDIICRCNTCIEEELPEIILELTPQDLFYLRILK